ncbi:MAG: HAD family hydrolase, partial [Gemmatimonadota bacterium]
MERPGIATRSRAEPATLVLATDLDGTFAGGTAEERRRLQRRLAEDAGAVLLYVTGRSVPATRELIAERELPAPALLIADVGTTVVAGGDFEPIAELESFLERHWPG